jgi:hypothetical protein
MSARHGEEQDPHAQAILFERRMARARARRLGILVGLSVAALAGALAVVLHAPDHQAHLIESAARCRATRVLRLGSGSDLTTFACENPDDEDADVERPTHSAPP